MESAGRTLADYLTSRVDDQLQAIVTYGPDSRTIVFIRENLHDSIAATDVFEVIELAREFNDTLRQVSSADLSTGDARFSVQAFEHSLILHMLNGQGGIVIALEPDVGRGLIEFVNDCLTEINLATLNLSRQE